MASRQIRKNKFAHRAYVGSRHRRDVKLQSMRATQKHGMHFMRHSDEEEEDDCAIQKVPCTSRLLFSRIGTDMFCAFLSHGLHRVLGVFLVAGLLCSNTLLVSRLDQVRTCIKNLKSLFIRAQIRHLRQIPPAN